MNELKKILLDSIRANGPMPLDAYMALALGDGSHGYYTRQDPFGSKGDFITAPEVSQVFGELLGLWGLDFWLRGNRAEDFNLVELGPGRGTLMRDMLAAAAIRPEFGRAARLHFLETSPVLRKAQNRALSGTGAKAHWHESEHKLLEACKGAPVIAYANEFFDALPIRQYVQKEGRWRMRHVQAEDARLVPVDIPTEIEEELPPATGYDDGDILETCPAGELIMSELAGYIAAYGGGLLIVDYGYAKQAPGDTFQAIADHAPVSPFDRPGDADLTAHVNFERLSSIARDGGCLSFGPVSQRGFLTALGLEERFRVLEQKADARQKNDLAAARRRLTGPDQMGLLFKALAVTDKHSPEPAGFETTGQNA